MAQQLQWAVLALESPAPDLSATLTSVLGQLSGYYWQLASWIDLYELRSLAKQVGRYDYSENGRGHLRVYG